MKELTTTEFEIFKATGYDEHQLRVVEAFNRVNIASKHYNSQLCDKGTFVLQVEDTILFYKLGGQALTPFHTLNTRYFCDSFVFFEEKRVLITLEKFESGKTILLSYVLDDRFQLISINEHNIPHVLDSRDDGSILIRSFFNYSTKSRFFLYASRNVFLYDIETGDGETTIVIEKYMSLDLLHDNVVDIRIFEMKNAIFCSFLDSDKCCFVYKFCNTTDNDKSDSFTVGGQEDKDSYYCLEEKTFSNLHEPFRGLKKIIHTCCSAYNTTYLLIRIPNCCCIEFAPDYDLYTDTVSDPVFCCVRQDRFLLFYSLTDQEEGAKEIGTTLQSRKILDIAICDSFVVVCLDIPLSELGTTPNIYFYICPSAVVFRQLRSFQPVELWGMTALMARHIHINSDFFVSLCCEDENTLSYFVNSPRSDPIVMLFVFMSMLSEDNFFVDILITIIHSIYRLAHDTHFTSAGEYETVSKLTELLGKRRKECFDSLLNVLYLDIARFFFSNGVYDLFSHCIVRTAVPVSKMISDLINIEADVKAKEKGLTELHNAIISTYDSRSYKIENTEWVTLFLQASNVETVVGFTKIILRGRILNPSNIEFSTFTSCIKQWATKDLFLLMSAYLVELLEKRRYFEQHPDLNIFDTSPENEDEIAEVTTFSYPFNVDVNFSVRYQNIVAFLTHYYDVVFWGDDIDIKLFTLLMNSFDVSVHLTIAKNLFKDYNFLEKLMYACDKHQSLFFQYISCLPFSNASAYMLFNMALKNINTEISLDHNVLNGVVFDQEEDASFDLSAVFASISNQFEMTNIVSLLFILALKQVFFDSHYNEILFEMLDQDSRSSALDIVLFTCLIKTNREFLLENFDTVGSFLNKIIEKYQCVFSILCFVTDIEQRIIICKMLKDSQTYNIILDFFVERTDSQNTLLMCKELGISILNSMRLVTMEKHGVLKTEFVEKILKTQC
ncbi:hypothetical protein PCE1_000404 [Barthelona sp. PCE]